MHGAIAAPSHSLPVQYTYPNDWQPQEEVEATVDQAFVQGSSRKTGEEGVNEQRSGHHNVFEKGVKENARHAAVVPVAVHKQEAAEEAELSNSKVTGVYGLKALLPADANAHLWHDIVRRCRVTSWQLLQCSPLLVES